MPVSPPVRGCRPRVVGHQRCREGPNQRPLPPTAWGFAGALGVAARTHRSFDLTARPLTGTLAAMDAMDQLELRLAFPGLPELGALARDFATHALQLADFEGEQLERLRDAFLSSLALIEDTLAREGDPVVDMEVRVTIDAVALEFQILEHGIPLGDTAGAEGPAPEAGGDITDRVRPVPAFDQLWWKQKGAAGSELHLRVHRPHAAIDVLEAVQHRLEEEHAEHTDLDHSDQTGEYRIRAYRPEDGLEVARRIYEAYGRSYANPDLYVPHRIQELNRGGQLHSIVCESPAGDIVGHYALERPDLGPTGEAGQAVIDHRHRGHGLMKPMRAAVEEAGEALGLLGIWSQPTAMHPLSQRMNIKFGSVPTAIQLGLIPGSMTLRGGVAGESADHQQGGRGSTFLYWHPFGDEPALAAHAPEPLHPLLNDLYEARGRKVHFGGDGPGPTPGGGEAVHCRYSGALGTAWVVADRIEPGAEHTIRTTVEAMVSGAGAGTVYVDLPLDDAGTPAVAEALLASGFHATGISPRCIPRADGRVAEDALRLAIHPVPVDLPGVVAEGPLGQRLLALATGLPAHTGTGR